MSHSDSVLNNSMLADVRVCMETGLTGNVAPLMHEIRHALQALYDDNKVHVIDLRSLPMAPGEEDKIIEALGHGEAQCQLSTLGLSEIHETRYAGVWMLTHFNNSNEITGRFIEITTMPEILKSQREDIQHSMAQLADELDESNADNESAERLC